ncbi:hypothetical protein HID58_096122, partial [Brassica napus]
NRFPTEYLEFSMSGSTGERSFADILPVFDTGSFIALLYHPIHCGLVIRQHRFSLRCVWAPRPTRGTMTIDRTYPIFTVRWLAVHGLAVPTVSFLGQYQQCSSSNDKPNSIIYRAMTQSNPNEQNVELNRTSLYWGMTNSMNCGGKQDKWLILLEGFLFGIRFIPVEIG